MPEVRPVELRWRLRTTAPLERTWALLSDTDRFNRVAGIDQSFEEEAQPDGSVKRTGTLRRAGIPLRWDERPFVWDAPRRFAVNRRFHGGPARSYVVSLDLTADPKGTSIDYRVVITPRVTVTRPAVVADARLFTRPGLDRALRRAVAVLDGERSLFDDPPPALPRRAGDLLERGLEGVRSPAVAKRLAQLIHKAPLRLQRQLNPLRLARRWQLPEAETVVAFLDAVAGGVLTVSWELRCPSCRVAKATAPRLGAGPRDVHCPSCNLPFDGSLPDNLVVGFGVDPRIRKIEEPLLCIGGPGRTPHILSQTVIQAGERVQFDVALLAGAYRLRTFPATSTASLQVRADVVGRALSLQLRGGTLSPGLLRAEPGRVTFDLSNELKRPVTLLVERPALEPDALTAGRLLELDDARAAIPPGMLHPDLDVTVTRSVVLAARLVRGGQSAREALATALKAWEPSAILARTDTVVATFNDGIAALRAASLLEGAPHLGGALSVGPVVHRRIDDRDTPCGGTVQRALALADAAAGGAVLVAVADAADAEVAGGLRLDGVQTEPHPAALGPMRVRLAHPARSAPPLRHSPPRMPPAAGLAVDGRYVLREALGGGGFGTAWLAADELGGEVVVKLLHPRLAEDPVQVQRFFNEGRLVRDIVSPYIARVLDHGRGREGHLFVAMERLHGEELWTIMKRTGTLHPARACALAIDILRGLEVAHAAGVVHRDLKPANLFVTRNADGTERARIIDFGVAKSLDSTDPALTTDGHAIGTPHYMAPEQVECHAIDGRTDLYALGTVLYEALSGKLPFEGDHSIALLLARVRSEPRALTQVLPAPLPRSLTSLIMRTIARDPERRPPNAAALRGQLETLLPELRRETLRGVAVVSTDADTVDFTPP